MTEAPANGEHSNRGTKPHDVVLDVCCPSQRQQLKRGQGKERCGYVEPGALDRVRCLDINEYEGFIEKYDKCPGRKTHEVTGVASGATQERST
jgi:hypothetical protein